MRIIQVITSLGIGGAERLTVELSDKFRDIPNIEQKVYALRKTNSFFEKSMEEKYIDIEFSKRSSLFSLWHIFDIYKQVRDFDIIQVHLFPANYFVAIAKFIFRFKGKIIVTEHSTNNRRRNYYFLKLLDRFIYSRYNKIICITEDTRINIIKWIPVIRDKTVVINNGIPLERYNNAESIDIRTELGLKLDDKLLLCVGGFRHQKNQELLIKALSKLALHFKLIFIGIGEFEDKNKELVRLLKLQDRVFFLGVKSNVEQYYKSCDLFVLPSKWEGFGLVAAEAMAAGIPVLVSNVDGLTKVVDSAGYKFVSENEYDLESSINRIFNNKSDMNDKVKKGIERAKLFSIEKMVLDYLNLYKIIKK